MSVSLLMLLILILCPQIHRSWFAFLPFICRTVQGVFGATLWSSQDRVSNKHCWDWSHNSRCCVCYWFRPS